MTFAFRDGVETALPFPDAERFQYELLELTSNSGALLFGVNASPGDFWPMLQLATPQGELLWLTSGFGASAAPYGDLVAIGSWLGLRAVDVDGELIYDFRELIDLPLLEVGGRFIDREAQPAGGNVTAVFTADGVLVREFRLPEGEFFANERMAPGVDGPIWGPAGSQLLLQTRTREGRINAVYLADLDTGELRLLSRSEPAAGNEAYGVGTWIALAFGP